MCLFAMLYPKMFKRILCTYSMYAACIKETNDFGAILIVLLLVCLATTLMLKNK